MTVEKLLPLACPLCGYAADTRCSRDGEIVWVQCKSEDCKTHGPTRYVEAEAIAAWNTRAALQDRPGVGEKRDADGSADGVSLSGSSDCYPSAQPPAPAGLDREEIARVIFEATPDRFMRASQALPAADAIIARLTASDDEVLERAAEVAKNYPTSTSKDIGGSIAKRIRALNPPPSRTGRAGRMCDYQGYEFGASYPDSMCIDGLLWDADSGDDEGLLTSGGELPCPRCSTESYLRYALEQAKDGGCGLSMWTPHVAMVSWEAFVAHARRENSEAAEIFLRTVPPFITDDWPDRDAVRANPSLWGNTVDREWRYTPPAPDGGERG